MKLFMEISTDTTSLKTMSPGDCAICLFGSLPKLLRDGNSPRDCDDLLLDDLFKPPKFSPKLPVIALEILTGKENSPLKSVVAVST